MMPIRVGARPRAGMRAGVRIRTRARGRIRTGCSHGLGLGPGPCRSRIRRGMQPRARTGARAGMSESAPERAYAICSRVERGIWPIVGVGMRRLDRRRAIVRRPVREAVAAARFSPSPPRPKNPRSPLGELRLRRRVGGLPLAAAKLAFLAAARGFPLAAKFAFASRPADSRLAAKFAFAAACRLAGKKQDDQCSRENDFKTVFM